MTAGRWTVLVVGLVLVAFIVWFFWLKRARGIRAAETAGGYQEVMVLVKGGYTLDLIVVRHGKPVRINFRREETAGCSDKGHLRRFPEDRRLGDRRNCAGGVPAEGARRIQLWLPDGHVPGQARRRIV